MKSKPDIIRKLGRTASAKNSLDLNRPSSEQVLFYHDSNNGTDAAAASSLHKLNRSGSSLSGYGGSGSALEIGSRSQRGLAGIGRGASYHAHARSTSGTSGISAWSSQTRESGGTTPVGGSFRHPWQQTPTVQRDNPIGGSYREPNEFDGRGGSDEDLRERERDREIQGRRSLQLGGGYGLGLDGVDEGYERYERPAFVRSNTSILSGSGASNRASYRADETRSYTPISQLPPPLAGSKGMGGLRVNTGSSGIQVAGVAGRGAGNVTPTASSSRINLGASLNGDSNPDINSVSALDTSALTKPILHNTTNNNSTSTNSSTLYNTAASSNLNLSGLNNSTGHLHTGSGITTSLSPHPSDTASPVSAFTGRTRPSMELHHRIRGLSEPKSSSINANQPVTVNEARRQWNERERLKEEALQRKEAKKQERRGRTSTTSIGSFALGNRGRSDTTATTNTAGTAATYSTAMGSVVSGIPSHRRGGSGATARQNSGVPGSIAPANSYGHSYHNSYDADDSANTQAPAFLDTGESYAPGEAELAAAAARGGGGQGREGREGSLNVNEVKEKIYAAKSKSHSAWASFMLWLKTKFLKMGRNSKKIVKGGKKKPTDKRQ